MDKSTLDSSCFNGAYKEFVELIGYKNTLRVYDYFAGQYVTFPKRLLSEEYLHEQIVKEYDGTNAKELARKYDYSYSWVRKILKKMAVYK
ncbi:Mor transcription activator family protein [Lysinibacillus sp. G4S2]|uniref:Mor transcription activator family protein n=1 Tax=Lysinibacillus sp. G4S2 TaxID=3055859 RepID=UPI0025A05E97|nr:Mor transcription activator family protein [Lysinibacillus sp. G4S2]MDM5251007.1 Mor transcription activator family protein [Lysinibacillus sp. G4S2]